MVGLSQLFSVSAGEIVNLRVDEAIDVEPFSVCILNKKTTARELWKKSDMVYPEFEELSLELPPLATVPKGPTCGSPNFGPTGSFKLRRKVRKVGVAIKEKVEEGKEEEREECARILVEKNYSYSLMKFEI